MNKLTDNNRATIKEWLKFSIFTIISLSLGVMIGFSVGRKHPAASVKDEWLSDVRKEVTLLEKAYKDTERDYQLGIELRDSIITALKREVIKGGNTELPIVINFDMTDK